MAIEDSAALGILFNKDYFTGDVKECLAYLRQSFMRAILHEPELLNSKNTDLFVSNERHDAGVFSLVHPQRGEHSLQSCLA